MKLNTQDVKLLLDWGFTEKDFSQIEEAMQKRKTKYEIDGKPASREDVINLLGRKQYLSGIARSAFHWTALQTTDDGRHDVSFDSSNLFRGEYISRDNLSKAVDVFLDDPSCPLHIAAAVDQEIGLAPAVDVVEVTRCEKCCHFTPSTGLCKVWECVTEEDGYCHRANVEFTDAD